MLTVFGFVFLVFRKKLRKLGIRLPHPLPLLPHPFFHLVDKSDYGINSGDEDANMSPDEQEATDDGMLYEQIDKQAEDDASMGTMSFALSRVYLSCH